MEMRVLREAEIRQCVALDGRAIEAVGKGFAKLGTGEAVVPPVLALPVEENNGEIDVKSAYISGLESIAVKIASGFYGNSRLSLPTGSGMMVMLSSKTGFPQALLLDNGYLTDVRTAAAGALAARYLAREDVDTVGVIGSGAQARYQVRALALVRRFTRLLVYGITEEHVSRYASEMRSELGIDVVAKESAEQVVRGSDIVVTTTPSHEPYLRAEWMHPGLHITAMGSDAPGKQELYPDVFSSADVVACDRKSQCFKIGELQHALAAGIVNEATPIIELGELVLGRHPGRQRDEQISVCDLTGVGVQDTAIAHLALEEARGRGLGTIFNS